MAESDPIRERYYASVKTADKATDFLFYVAAILSVLSLFVEPTDAAYDAAMVAFVLAVIAYFAVGASARMYFIPRAEHKRRQDFLGRAFGFDLIHERTEGYYNNDAKEGPRRLAANLLENTFFTKELTRRIAHTERVRVAVYAVLWVAVALARETNFGIILAATQVIFSEQILSKALRVEWLRARSERVYEDVTKLLQSAPAAAKFQSFALDSMLVYETAKATAAVVIPDKLFHKWNTYLSAEWNRIRQQLKI